MINMTVPAGLQGDSSLPWCWVGLHHLYSVWWKLIFVRRLRPATSHHTTLPSILSASFRGKTNKQTNIRRELADPGRLWWKSDSSNQSNSIRETLSIHCRRPQRGINRKTSPASPLLSPGLFLVQQTWKNYPEHDSLF